MQTPRLPLLLASMLVFGPLGAAAEFPEALPKKTTATQKNPDLTGKWRVFLPAGFEREITITAGEAGEYHLAPKSLTFGGAYELKDGVLVSVLDPEMPRGQFFWHVNSPYLITLTEQTANVGSDYTGAVLFRKREVAK